MAGALEGAVTDVVLCTIPVMFKVLIMGETGEVNYAGQQHIILASVDYVQQTGRRRLSDDSSPRS